MDMKPLVTEILGLSFKPIYISFNFFPKYRLKDDLKAPKFITNIYLVFHFAALDL